jgi:hypothetical protein
MSNTINYAQIFNSVLDEKFAILSRTNYMEQNSNGIVWQGGKTINVPKLTLQGLGAVSGCTIPDGDYTFEYEPFQLQWDRGRKFSIPRYAVDETNFALTVGNIMGEFMRQHIVPEVDKLRLSTVATKAVTAGNVTYAGTTLSTPLASLLADIASVQDKIGEDVQLYIAVAQTVKAQIMASSEITKYLSVRDFEIRSVNLKMDAINDQYLIGVPSSYMKSAFTAYDGTTSGQEAGGVVPAAGAVNVNWIITASNACVAVGYPRVEKVIDPDTNQQGDCWLVAFRIYHGIIIPDNKVDGIWVNLMTTDPNA